MKTHALLVAAAVLAVGAAASETPESLRAAGERSFGGLIPVVDPGIGVPGLGVPQLLRGVPQCLGEDVLLGVEVPVDGRPADPGRLADLVDPDGVPPVAAQQVTRLSL